MAIPLKYAYPYVETGHALSTPKQNEYVQQEFGA